MVSMIVSDFSSSVYLALISMIPRCNSSQRLRNSVIFFFLANLTSSILFVVGDTGVAAVETVCRASRTVTFATDA